MFLEKSLSDSCMFTIVLLKECQNITTVTQDEKVSAETFLFELKTYANVDYSIKDVRTKNVLLNRFS